MKKTSQIEQPRQPPAKTTETSPDELMIDLKSGSRWWSGRRSGQVHLNTKQPRRSMPLLGGALLTVFLAAGLGLMACGGPPSRAMRIGDNVPDFTLPSLDGGEISADDLAGDVVVLNFWATWCAPCRVEAPVLQQLAAEGVRVIGIALDEEGRRAVEPYALSQGLDYTILLGNQEIFQRFDGMAIPYTLVLDPSGKIVNYYRGPATRDALLEDIASAGETTVATPAGV